MKCCNSSGWNVELSSIMDLKNCFAMDWIFSSKIITFNFGDTVFILNFSPRALKDKIGLLWTIKGTLTK
jgi:hypothetical protein